LSRIDPLREAPIVGIEPPEIYSMKHDYMDLLPELEQEITPRIGNIWLLDEFLLRSSEFDSLRIGTDPGRADTEEMSSKKKIRFHPHCHQRAEGPSSDGLPTGTSASLELLRSLGYDVELMDTGCCGMAGTFGYEAEHYDLSMKVGELKLFPQLRSASKATDEMQTVSSGAACRMQIEQGTGMKAIHPIVLVARSLR
jgi:Fe-S oxidoreductase